MPREMTNTAYVQVGTIPAKDLRRPAGGMDLEYFVVAKVCGSSVKYFGIDTWQFPNFMRIGAWASLDPLTRIRRVLTPDLYFLQPFNQGTAALAAAVKAWPRGFNPPDNSRNDIGAVIVFVNTAVKRNLGLPRDLQATLDFDESYDSFLEYIEGTATFDNGRNLGRLLEDDDSPLNVWAKLEIWVLPRRRNPPANPANAVVNDLVKWPAGSNLVARDFLDRSLPINDGPLNRMLFVEVRIVKDPDWKAKDVAFKRREGGKQVRNKPTKGSAGVGTGRRRNRPAASGTAAAASPRRNPRRGVRGAVEEDDEEGVEEDAEEDADEEEEEVGDALEEEEEVQGEEEDDDDEGHDPPPPPPPAGASGNGPDDDDSPEAPGPQGPNMGGFRGFVQQYARTGVTPPAGPFMAQTNTAAPTPAGRTTRSMSSRQESVERPGEVDANQEGQEEEDGPADQNGPADRNDQLGDDNNDDDNSGNAPPPRPSQTTWAPGMPALMAWPPRRAGPASSSRPGRTAAPSRSTRMTQPESEEVGQDSDTSLGKRKRRGGGSRRKSKTPPPAGKARKAAASNRTAGSKDGEESQDSDETLRKRQRREENSMRKRKRQPTAEAPKKATTEPEDVEEADGSDGPREKRPRRAKKSREKSKSPLAEKSPEKSPELSPRSKKRRRDNRNGQRFF
ncbi:hypothetical protein TI39_contig686g00005 [Zymoseptoria brevis]|uniref:Uncharacterized protein n=1 Tax=Zymoseptoria brevis TaxID=1047168 RepID=A0A0F4GG58_9PEZI|nr:hypothetical protein TI39_contig686g00005 [Zymoseptoria brevis]